jgi:hypothetical protein
MGNPIPKELATALRQDNLAEEAANLRLPQRHPRTGSNESISETSMVEAERARAKLDPPFEVSSVKTDDSGQLEALPRKPFDTDRGSFGPCANKRRTAN